MAHDNTVQERVQELTWALVDDQINDDEMKLLDSLMLSDDAARDTYVDCVQLHIDLLAHFSEESQQPTASSPMPVVGLLTEGAPPVDMQSSPS